jgi:hypothetical protein
LKSNSKEANVRDHCELGDAVTAKCFVNYYCSFTRGSRYCSKRSSVIEEGEGKEHVKIGFAGLEVNAIWPLKEHSQQLGRPRTYFFTHGH